MDVHEICRPSNTILRRFRVRPAPLPPFIFTRSINRSEIALKPCSRDSMQMYLQTVEISPSIYCTFLSLSLSLFLLRLARDQSWANILFGEHCPREFLHNTYENGEYANSSKIATHAKNTFYIVTNKMSSNIIPMNHLHSLYLHLYFSSCNRECKKKKEKYFVTK